MLCFIDESGDPGIGDGSDYFVMAMVVFPDAATAQAADDAIDDLRKNLGFGRREFKFSAINNRIRDAFFPVITPKKRNFAINVVVIDTRNSFAHQKLPSDSAFYQALHELLNMADFNNASIFLDGGTEVKKLVREGKTLYNRLTRKIKPANSKNDNRIQLADMVAGAIARSYYPHKSDHDRWRKMLKLTKNDTIHEIK